MLHSWLSDCRLLTDLLLSPLASRVGDKRLAMELGAFGLSFLEDDTLTLEVYHSNGDMGCIHRWPTDCFTKSMRPTLINKTLDENFAQMSETTLTRDPVSAAHAPLDEEEYRGGNFTRLQVIRPL